jgi:hypothetical protein
MALRKLIKTEGKSIIQTSLGDIACGVQQLSFVAYIKVITVHGNKNEISVNVNFIGDAAQFTKHYQVPVVVEAGSPNFIQQAYEHLKTLPEFAGATDC